VLSQLITITACFGQASSDVAITNSIQRGDLSTISTTHFNPAHNIYKDTIQIIACVFLNSTSIPVAKLFSESAAKKNLTKSSKRSFWQIRRTLNSQATSVSQTKKEH